MNLPYLPSHLLSHLPNILGFGWVSDALHGVPQVAPSEQLAGNVEATQMVSLLAGFQWNFQDPPHGVWGPGVGLKSRNFEDW